MVDQMREVAGSLRVPDSGLSTSLPLKETMLKLEILNELAVILGAVANGTSKRRDSHFRWRITS